jgi:hypothetical protein
MKILMICSLCSLLTSCAVPAARQGHVRLVDDKPVGANYLGRVSATAEGKGTLLHRQTFQKALDGALNQAESLGATHLVLDQWYDEPRFWGYDQSVKGNAYQLR